MAVRVDVLALQSNAPANQYNHICSPAAGERFAITCITVFNGSVGAIAYYLNIKRGAFYYPFDYFNLPATTSKYYTLPLRLRDTDAIYSYDYGSPGLTYTVHGSRLVV